MNQPTRLIDFEGIALPALAPDMMRACQDASGERTLPGIYLDPPAARKNRGRGGEFAMDNGQTTWLAATDAESRTDTSSAPNRRRGMIRIRRIIRRPRFAGH